jgi:hypothetical protein
VSGYLCDVGRLVIQCACERSARWSGEDAARSQGWRGGWRARGAELRRVWLCPDCYRPPVLAPVRKSVAVTLPGFLRDLIAGNQRALVREQLEAVRAEDPERFRGLLEAIEREGKHGSKPAIREAWAAPLRAFGIEVAWAARKKTRRAQPLQKGTAS